MTNWRNVLCLFFSQRHRENPLGIFRSAAVERYERWARTQGCQVIMRKIRIHARKAIPRRIKNTQSGNMGIKIKKKIVLPIFLQIFLWNYIFSNCFNILITNFRFANTKLYTTPQQEYAYASKLALHSCDNSQLWVKSALSNTYIWRDRNVISEKGMIERAARIISII